MHAESRNNLHQRKCIFQRVTSMTAKESFLCEAENGRLKMQINFVCKLAFFTWDVSYVHHHEKQELLFNNLQIQQQFTLDYENLEVLRDFK